MNARSVIILILLGVFIVLCLQNVEDITIHFLFWSFAISKLLILLLTFIIGIFIGILMVNIMKKESRTDNKQQESKTSAKEG
jgi:putative membrane protein